MITKDNNYKVLKLFFDAPEKKIHVRLIARLTGLSASGVLKIVARLKKEGLLLSEKNAAMENIFAAKSNRFMQLKLCNNLLAVHECGLVDFLRDVYGEPQAIVLFGSFAHGEDISTSDVDIAVVSGESLHPDLKKFEAMLGRKISIYEVRLDACKKEFINNLANGIVLHGYLQVVQ